MAITIKCPDCGHTKQSDDGDEETCPECEGTMAPPPKKKYQAKTESLEEESRGKKKSKPRDEDDDEEKGDGSTRDGKAAASLELDPGFKNRELMKQVEGELSRGEVLHFACRPCPKIARMQGVVAACGGGLFVVIGIVVATVMLIAGSAKVPIFVLIVPCGFVLIGGLIAVLGPIMKARQARLGWYAVTDRRALVFSVALWGKSGQVEIYQPAELRKMWVKKSFWVKGAGDLVFKTTVTQRTERVRDASGRTRTSTSTSTQRFGFLGIEDVKDVEALVHEVLLTVRDDDDDDD